MIGLPLERTQVEKALYLVGLSGAGLGLLMSAAAFLSFISAMGGIFSFGFFAGPLFFTGATGVVFGLTLTAISQGLGSLRLIAHNSANLEMK